jgi:hypothetical protein
MEVLRALLILAAVLLLAVSCWQPKAAPFGWACAVAGFGMPIMQAGFH